MKPLHSELWRTYLAVTEEIKEQTTPVLRFYSGHEVHDWVGDRTLSVGDFPIDATLLELMPDEQR